MSIASKCLVEAGYVANAETTAYIATGIRTVLDKWTVQNSDLVSHTYTVKLVPSGGTPGASHVMLTKTLVAGEVYTCPEIAGQVLNVGDFISEIASAASVIVRRISGREIS